MSFLSELLGASYKEGMTEEEISKALEDAKDGDSAEINRLKNALSKANSEAADYKKKLREKQSDDEAKRAEEKEMLDKIMQENADLKKSITLANKKTKLIAMGYDEKLADETALAMIEGDFDTVLSNQSKYLDAQKKIIESDLMKNTPRPNGGGDGIDKPTDYGKLIEQAKADGNYAEIAYYTRLQALEEIKENEQ